MFNASECFLIVHKRRRIPRTRACDSNPGVGRRMKCCPSALFETRKSSMERARLERDLSNIIRNHISNCSWRTQMALFTRIALRLRACRTRLLLEMRILKTFRMLTR